MQYRKSSTTLLRRMLMLGLVIAASLASAQDKKPNILVLFGDDIGIWNVGAYTHRMMGRTPKGRAATSENQVRGFGSLFRSTSEVRVMSS